MTTDEDVAVEIHVLDGASDPDGDTLTVTSVSAEGHRSEILDGGVVKVTPNQDFNGTIHVSYDVLTSLAGHTTVTGLATVTVRPVNDAPVATGGTLTLHGTSMIVLSGHDVDGDVLTYEVVAGPTHGTLSGSAPALRYAPEPGFVGDDAITYRVSDSRLTSEPATIQLHDTLGSAPTAFAHTVQGTEDQPSSVVLDASDPDHDPLTFTIVTPPQHGTLSGTAPNLVYTPALNFNGPDSLQFSVSDGFLSSSTVTIDINVQPVNDAPVAMPQTVAATEDMTSNITLQGSDAEGDPLTFELRASPLHGTLVVHASTDHVTATWSYTPASNYHGPDSFTFDVVDSSSARSSATVTIDVASVNDPPVAGPFSVSLDEDTSAFFVLRGSDIDGDPLGYTIVKPPAHGRLGGTAPSLVYWPDTNYNGPDSFTYTVSDGTVTSAPATVSLSVAAVNDPLIARDSSVTTAEDTPVAITLQASDADGDRLSSYITSYPSDGDLTGSGTRWTYTPAPNAFGTRSFKAYVYESPGYETATVTVTINITPVNDPPTTVDDFVATDPDKPLSFSVTSNDFDIDDTTIQLDSVDAPTNGTIEIVDGQLLYTPDAGFTGVDVFAYTVVDPHGARSTGHVHVAVGVAFPPGAPTEKLLALAIDTTDARNAPSISGDGRYIAFTSMLALDPEDTNGVADVYLYDRGNRAVTRISKPPGGGSSNGASMRPNMSADGRYIVFESIAANLVAGDTNQTFDVFRHDRVTGETIRVSVASGGGQANGPSTDARISDDGNRVAFASRAFDLVPNDANGASDIFVRDLVAGTTTRVSVSITGNDADLDSLEPALSGDGRFVAFSSAASNLVVGDANNASDVFVRDLGAGTTTRVSVSSTGGEANAPSTGPSLSRDGRFISFLSSATNLVSADSTQGSVQLYVRDTQAPTTTRTLSASGVRWARLSGDGRYVTVLDWSGVLIHDRFAAMTVSPSGASTWRWPAISSDGRYVAVLDTSSGGSLTVTPNPL